MRNYFALSTLCVTASFAVASASTTTTEKKSSSSSYTTVNTRRVRNLDHWDADTLAYYLGIDATTGKPLEESNYVGTDAAILFYAQWCKNCHAFAPSWDAIATLLSAGLVKSKLIMALFDCEFNTEHMKLCNAVGVKHYPTMMFVGSGKFQDSDFLSRALVGKDKAEGPAGVSPLPRTVKFQGNWQYPEAVMDWIRAMQGLSRWHRWTTQGVLRFLRDGMMGFLRKKKNKATLASLPVGIPMVGGGGGGSSSTSSPQEVRLLETKLNQSKLETKQMTKVATQASLLISNVLFPPTASNNKTVDVFTEMVPKWNSQDLQDTVFQTCVVELAVDYCSRLTTHVATEFVNTVPEKDYPTTMAEIETLLQNQVQQAEPYCILLEDCIVHEFKNTTCRPDTCPFEQDVACRYLTSCKEPSIQKEYAIMLGLIAESDVWPPKQPVATATTTTTAGSGGGAAPKATAAAGTGGWGVVKEDKEQIKV